MAKALKHRKPIKAKSKCCKSKPRCKRCPVVLKRLQQRGFAERGDDGRYVIVDVLRKKDLKALRH